MPFGSLWLPVVVSAVAVWIGSAILHMVLKYHKADYKQLANEEAVAAAVRQGSPAPGVYVIPYCPDMSQMKDPAVQKRYADGPVALITVMRNGLPRLGKYLFQWFLFCVLVSFITGTVSRHALHPGEEAHHVFHFVILVAFAGYGLGYIQDSIWKAIPWSNTLRSLIDAVIYAAITGGVFVWLWPAS